jgi:hypothetical protein
MEEGEIKETTTKRTNFKQDQVKREISRMEERIRLTQAMPNKSIEVVYKMRDYVESLKKKLDDLRKNQERQRKHRTKRLEQLKISKKYTGNELLSSFPHCKWSECPPILNFPVEKGENIQLIKSEVTLPLSAPPSFSGQSTSFSYSFSGVTGSSSYQVSILDNNSICRVTTSTSKPTTPVDLQLVSLTQGRLLEFVSGSEQEFNNFVYICSSFLLTHDPRISLRLFELRGCYLMDCKAHGKQTARSRMVQRLNLLSNQ